MSRIDRIYAPKDILSDAFGYTFDPGSYSDHDLMSVQFNCKQTSIADLDFGNLILV